MQEGAVATAFLDGKWFSIVLMSLSLNFPGSDLWLVRFTTVLQARLPS